MQLCTWDNNGNLLNDGVNTYDYDSANRLTSISGGQSATYAYNGLGDRLTQNGVNYTLDLNSGLTQVLNDGTNTYLYGLGRIAQVNTTTLVTDYFMTDALGSVRQLTDSQGDITLANAYEPYGTLAQTAGSAQTSYGFTGEFTDPSGMVYLRARYYMPSDGRFLTRDTWVGDTAQPISFNHFIYTYDNPINFIDPEGSDPIPPWMAKYLEQLRADTEKCYNEGDVNCVWSNYRQLAIGGYFFSSHASRHMMNFLTKGGDIKYETALFGQSSSKWVMESKAVGQVIPKIRQELLRAIWIEAKQGKTESGYPRPDTKLYTIDLDSSNTDVYYGLGKFSFWAEADYKITGCYDVEVKPIYRFQDRYDWNAGMFAGGTIPGVSGFEDNWAQMLVDHDMAKGFNISGSWAGPNKKYTFSSEWLNLR